MIRPDTPQPLTLIEAVIPVAALILLVALSYFLFGDKGAGGPNQVALVVATMIAVFIAWRRGHALASLGDGPCPERTWRIEAGRAAADTADGP